jgi:hypothetical protein
VIRFFKPSRNWGMLLLAVWLIVTGVLYFAPNLSFARSGDILAALAIAAGVLLLLGR